MRKVKEILRLRLLGGVKGARRIGLTVGCGKTAVATTMIYPHGQIDAARPMRSPLDLLGSAAASAK